MTDRGWDVSRKVNGSKRHVAVAPLRLLLVVLVTAASVRSLGGAVCRHVSRMPNEGVRMSGRSVAVDDVRREFSLLGKRQVSEPALARPVTTGVRSRAVLELQQNHGGAQFTALVGGEFVPGEGDRVAWRVRHWETVRPTPQQGDAARYAAAGPTRRAGSRCGGRPVCRPQQRGAASRTAGDRPGGLRPGVLLGAVRNGRRAPAAHPAGGRLRIARGADHQVLGGHRPNSGGAAQTSGPALPPTRAPSPAGVDRPLPPLTIRLGTVSPWTR